MEFSNKKEEYKWKEVGVINVLKLNRPLDQKSLPVLDNTVKTLFQKKMYKVVLDLAQVTSISSSGIGLLINLTQNEGNESLRLICVNQRFKALFDLLSLGERILIFPYESEAFGSWEKH